MKLEKAAEVYCKAKDRDNLSSLTDGEDRYAIQRDLAYTLKECQQILFLRGNKILYREKGKPFLSDLYCTLP
ncbi:hypothetical protein BUALT_Bualt02G0202200 [Buddleja alternifolia]|uniref:Uncharacterized protein n=1 Tax=Buddleja alternifolia TaxID=168488 RepID=A0AAV6Y600_9LAMI|nr:hypothetical protein BUALT_Bualt02G0202200 [Buddleja alternifolia]